MLCDLSTEGRLRRANVLVVVADCGQQIDEVVVVEAVGGVSRLASDVDKTRLAMETKVLRGRVVAHGGTTGAIIESAVMLAVVPVFAWVALRERRRRSKSRQSRPLLRAYRAMNWRTVSAPACLRRQLRPQHCGLT